MYFRSSAAILNSLATKKANHEHRRKHPSRCQHGRIPCTEELRGSHRGADTSTEPVASGSIRVIIVIDTSNVTAVEDLLDCGLPIRAARVSSMVPDNNRIVIVQYMYDGQITSESARYDSNRGVWTSSFGKDISNFLTNEALWTESLITIAERRE